MRSIRSTAAAWCALSLTLTWGAAGAAPLHDTDVVVDSRLVRGAPGSARVAVFAARDFDRRASVAGAEVRLALEVAGEARALARAHTDAGGEAALSFRVPADIPAGRHLLRVDTRSSHGRDRLSYSVEVVERVVVHLRTDRGVYQPGQTLRWRVTLLNGADARPLADEAVAVDIRDARDTSMWRGTVKTDRHGMVAGDLPLGEALVAGRWRVKARAGGTEVQEKIQVRTVRLPAFRVDLVRADASVSGFSGRVVARYDHGEPVAGRARVHLGGEVLVSAPLDRFGQLPLVVPPERYGRLLVEVVDGAHRSETAALDLNPPSDALEVEVVSAHDPMPVGVPQDLHVLIGDGGRALDAQVELDFDGRRYTARAEEGVARFRVTPRAVGRANLTVHAELEDGRGAGAGRLFDVGPVGPVVRARRAVVAAGEAIEIEGRWPGRQGTLVATLIRDGAPLATALVDQGRAAFSARLQPPVGVHGVATVRITRLDWADDSGEVDLAHAATTVFLRPRVLDVKVSAPTRHRPGARVPVQVEVRDAEGRPVPGAGLAASVVDERVLRLSPERPDLVVALRRLAAGNARAAGLHFADLLAREETPALRRALRAIVDALPEEEVTPRVRLAAADRIRGELARLQRAASHLWKWALEEPASVGRFGPRGWTWRASLAALLTEADAPAADRRDPWGRDTPWPTAVARQPDLAFAPFVERMADERLDRLEQVLLEDVDVARPHLADDALAEWAAVAPWMLVDPWGGRVRVEARRWRGKTLFDLRAPGPDRAYETDDDRVRSDILREGPRPRGYPGAGLGMRGFGQGGGGGVAYGRGGTARVAGAAIRANFDETVLWAVGLPTDAAGRASLVAPLSDSLTGWRVAVEALGPLGGVGAAQTRLESFLPLQVEVEVPPRLAVGDRYTLAAVVANFSGEAQVLRVRSKVSGALRAAADVPAVVELPDGATTSVPLPVEAIGVGEGTVALTLLAGAREVDALRRTLTVEAPGPARQRAYAFGLRDGQATLKVEPPADAAQGTLSARVRVFRGVSDQALDGLESLLAEPHGCFEQTSSTTYPNLLVLRLLEEGAPAAARARDLVAKGYQRLVSFEVDGGGFSWFGEAPANQVLTAYGLMQFVDMAVVHPVDPELIERTRAWLQAQQKGDGSWAPDPSWLHDWSAVQGAVATTAWIAFALAESGAERGVACAAPPDRGRCGRTRKTRAATPLDRALSFLRQHEDELAAQPYLTALWAAAENGEWRARALAKLREHAQRKDERLRFSAGGQTLFYANGAAADLQVTSLAVPSLFHSAQRADAEAAWAAVWAGRGGRGWGTTQGTVMALRAAATLAGAEAPSGEVEVRVGGRAAGALDLDGEGVPTLPLRLRAGDDVVELVGASGLRADAELRLDWRGARPAEAESRGLELAYTAPERVALREAAVFELTLRNPGAEAVPMPTLVVPVPPGFTADAAALERLQQSGRVARAEDVGHALHLYLTELGAGAEVELDFELRPHAACDVLLRGPTAYAYYDPETRAAAAARRVRATAEPTPVR